MAHEEESEFDREDDHEHSSDCGHTPEQHKKLQGRVDRLQKNFKKFLADNADDMLEPGMYEKLVTKLEKRLRMQGLNPSSLSTIKAFREGFEFGIITHMNVGSEAGRIFAGINKMVMDKEKKGPQLDIDITKSKPLPLKEDDPQ